MNYLFVFRSLFFWFTCMPLALTASQAPSLQKESPSSANGDMIVLSRAKAFEELKKRPQLIKYLQDNKDALGLTGIPSQEKKDTSVPQQNSQQAPVVRELLQTLKQEQEKSPQRPLFVSVNVNTQNLNNEVRSVQTTETGLSAPLTHSSYASFFMNWIRTNKRRCMWYCAAGCWGVLQVYLQLIRRYVQERNGWACWKKHLALEELYRMTTSTMIKEIISWKITCSKELMLATEGTILNLCIKETENELATLLSYKSILSWIQRLPLRYVCLYKGTLIEEITEQIQRLQYIKNTILSFLEELVHKGRQEQRTTQEPVLT